MAVSVSAAEARGAERSTYGDMGERGAARS
jgi:hypothetical protein